jgi:hypothetical protein
VLTGLGQTPAGRVQQVCPAQCRSVVRPKHRYVALRVPQGWIMFSVDSTNGRAAATPTNAPHSQVVPKFYGRQQYCAEKEGTPTGPLDLVPCTDTHAQGGAHSQYAWQHTCVDSVSKPLWRHTTGCILNHWQPTTLPDPLVTAGPGPCVTIERLTHFNTRGNGPHPARQYPATH